MTVIDLLITIIVVTILVTIALGVATYVAYKLRLARQPGLAEDEGQDARYFVLHEPPTDSPPQIEAETVDAA